MVECWSGPPGLAKNLQIPENDMRLKKFRSLGYMKDAPGFGIQRVNHTFMWGKEGITLEVGMEARVGFLMADGESMIKKYKFTSQNIESQKEMIVIPPI
ncbi:hypothetical protein COCOBI_04-1430 [Coccomyxa sp. Obi]|nr:hypothetical protein COCOBI_04-1430 [Coccomyxa sp. Obi]